ncbi:hypothetical protein [Lacipirellula limnantheis]|uniref:hypothetical protein n=1 Tax=Lacipirellula limnantheis TaxID=2528024 RepID=UPI0011A5A9C0|nr:hypothetical protein [Lacipirellula limnantheis]
MRIDQINRKGRAAPRRSTDRKVGMARAPGRRTIDLRPSEEACARNRYRHVFAIEFVRDDWRAADLPLASAHLGDDSALVGAALTAANLSEGLSR